MFRKPNFFIIGAPKCGTTSLATWLSEHPRIFMSNPKELDFFNTDIRQAYRDDLVRYESFFREVGEQHLAVGEASTGYLRSHVAVPAILDYVPDARFVVGLRNPIEMAISWHSQMLFAAWENEADFATAWALQRDRHMGRKVPALCPDPSNLLYAEVCGLGAQVERLLTIVPESRVFFYTLDEMRENTAEVYARLLAFLEVPHDGRKNFPVLNEAKRVPAWLSVLTTVVYDLKRRMGIRTGLGIVNGLNRHLARKPARNADYDAIRSELKSYFSDDILLLESLLHRDLSGWLVQSNPLAKLSR